MNDSFKFESFVSLGTECPVAASMSKYGLRSWSGVFDWLVTESLPWVLYYIENDFEGFLEKEDLEMIQDDPKRFKNKSNGFKFLHEEEPFQEEYEKIKKKYEKK